MARPHSHPAIPDAPMSRAAETSGRRPLAVSLLISLRPGQWTKNLIVFAGLLFSLKLFEPAAILTVDRGLRHLLRALGRRVSGQRRHGSRERSASSDEVPAADRGRRPSGLRGARRGRRHRRAGASAAAFALGWRFGAVAAGYLGPSGALLGSAEAHRHHRRADDCDRLRPARGRGRRRRSTSSSATGCSSARFFSRCSSRWPSGGTSWCCWPTVPPVIGRFSVSIPRTFLIR